MSAGTKIEWCDATWNPIVGCSHVSPGCDNCYAARMATRLAANPATRAIYKDIAACGHWSGETRLVEKALSLPSQWKKPKKIFVCSMGDLFHESVPFDWITRVLCETFCSPHTFLILTKRADRMLDYILSKPMPKQCRWPLPNVWLGVTAENQEKLDKRVPILLDTPAAIRFVSIEPMLGEISLRWAMWRPLSGTESTDEYDGLRMLDWIIVGGESGPGARPMRIEWLRQVRDDCAAAGVPFFFKQYGDNAPESSFDFSRGICATMQAKKHGNVLDGRTHREFPVCWEIF